MMMRELVPSTVSFSVDAARVPPGALRIGGIHGPLLVGPKRQSQPSIGDSVRGALSDQENSYSVKALQTEPESDRVGMHGHVEP